MQSEHGLSRQDLLDELNDKGVKISRQGLVNAIKLIKDETDIVIESRHMGQNIHRYFINHDTIEKDDNLRFVSILASNMMQADFLKKFRKLGMKVQPSVISAGNEFLDDIGTALEKNLKLKVRYCKFEGEAYDAIIHPYCIKASLGRWYLFAYKENSNHPEAIVQTFSLDRFLSIRLTKDRFFPNSSVDLERHFYNSFGAYIDLDNYPVRQLLVACTQKVANYLRSLPLHHSQRELPADEVTEYMTVAAAAKAMDETNVRLCFFTFYISPTPDFMSELRRWGDECKVIE